MLNLHSLFYGIKKKSLWSIVCSWYSRKQTEHGCESNKKHGCELFYMEDWRSNNF